MATVLRSLLQRLPPGLVRYFGVLQFKVPFLRPLIMKVASSATQGAGIIPRGIGQGLHFDATGGLPGYLLGTSEPEEQELLASLLREGQVFYDIGANVGFYGVSAARIVGEAGHVYLFEPFAESAGWIKKNMSLNGFTNYTLTQKVISNQPGEVSFGIGSDSGKHSIMDWATPKEGQHIAVPAITLDGFVAENGPRLPDVVMIDVEGAELLVFQGMVEVIRRAQPTILCEVHWMGPDFLEFLEKNLVEPLGYTITTYAGEPVPKEPVRYHALMTPRKGSRSGV